MWNVLRKKQEQKINKNEKKNKTKKTSDTLLMALSCNYQLYN